MGRKWLDHLIQHDYLPAIAKLKNTAKGQQAAKNLLGQMRQDWTDHSMKELKQQQSLMDQTRRAIKDEFGEDHFSLEFIAFTGEEYFEINRLKQGNARERQLHQLFLHDPDAIAAKAVELLKSPEWADIAAGLAVLTGRRLNEVLKTAEFSIKSRWVITFRGALKRRGEAVPLVFDIPCLTTAKRVVQATERLRAITPARANENKVAK